MQSIMSKLTEYKVMEHLASGRTARVFKALEKKTNKYVAIKCVRDLQKKKLNEMVRNEVEILKTVESRHIVRMSDFFEEGGYLYIVLEYCNGGNLKELVERQPAHQLPQKEALELLAQIVEGFKALYSHNCLHRDFKADNILMHNGVAKIADFGGSVLMADINELHKSYFGTKAIFAPERARCSTYGTKADVYSLGAVFYYMLYGCYPGTSKLKEMDDQNSINRNLSLISYRFLEGTLEADKKKRLGWEEIFQMQLSPQKSMLIPKPSSTKSQIVSTTKQTLISSIRSSKPASTISTTTTSSHLVPPSNNPDDVASFQIIQQIYIEDVEEFLFKVDYMQRSMAVLSYAFPSVQFGENLAMILKYSLAQIGKIYAKIGNKTNVYGIEPLLFARFLGHKLCGELTQYIKSTLQDLEVRYNQVRKPLIAYIRANNLNQSFADELERPEFNEAMFQNNMIDFYFRIESWKEYTKDYNVKVTIYLLRYMILEMMSAKPTPKDTLSKLIDSMGSSQLDRLQQILVARYDQVTNQKQS